MPVLHATLTGGVVKIVQQKFTYLIVDKPDDTLWFIPLFYRTESEQKMVEISQKDTTLEVKFDKYLHLNSNSTSFVRVNYDDELLIRLLNKDNFDSMNVSEKYQLLDDALALFKNGTRHLD